MATIARSAVSASVSSRVVATPRPFAVSSVRSSCRLPARKFAAPTLSAPSRSSTTAQAVPMEVVQLASDASFIFGTAVTMFAVTLVGLAVGFVLLRVESLVEEGKI